MIRTFLLASVAALSSVLLPGCSSPRAEKEPSAPTAWEHGEAPIAYPAISDNVQHDTLLIQTTFDLGDSTYVMVAGNVEETFEGIRLFRYQLLPDSTARILSYSTPGYDSWTMLPKFFKLPGVPRRHAILANFGERESWGQKLLLMDSAFSDLGFLDVALPNRVIEDDSLRLKRGDIGQLARLALHADTMVITFACDSVYLYDDQMGNLDRVVASPLIRYTYHDSTGLLLWYNGERRAVKKPA